MLDFLDPHGDPSKFLAAILAAPADDLPRLQFADWLDERGDQWADFIRDQISGVIVETTPPSAMAAFRHVLPKSTEFAAQASSRDKQTSQVDVTLRNGAKWHVYAVIRRGFLESMRVTWGFWSLYGPNIVRRAPVRKVELLHPGPRLEAQGIFTRQWRWPGARVPRRIYQMVDEYFGTRMGYTEQHAIWAMSKALLTDASSRKPRTKRPSPTPLALATVTED